MNNPGPSCSSIYKMGSRTVHVGSSGVPGAVVKVSSSTPVIQGPNGSLTLVVTSSSASMVTPSPNVSIGNLIGKHRGGGSKLTTTHVLVNNNKDKKLETGGGHGKGGKKVDAKVTLHADLRSIMHAFGDDISPSEESVHLIEVILRQEMEAFIFICDTAALLTGTKTLGLRECIYAMRNDQGYLSRLFKYLAYKDEQKLNTRRNLMANQKLTGPYRSYFSEIREILNDIDECGDIGRLLEGESTAWDGGKTERAYIMDRMNQRLIMPKFITYAKARSVSFARKLTQLQEWVTAHLHSECKLSPNFMEVLSFLTYEFVARLVDLSYVIKRERMGNPNDMYRILDTRGANPDTCMSAPAFQKKRKDEECNTVSEILVQASELEAKRLNKVSTSNKEVLDSKAVDGLSVCEIREAYIRFQKSHPPSFSYVRRADILRNFN